MKHIMGSEEEFEIVTKGGGTAVVPSIPAGGREILATETYVADLVNYTKISVSQFSIQSSVASLDGTTFVEYGKEIKSVTFNYSFSKAPEESSLTDKDNNKYEYTISQSGTAEMKYDKAIKATSLPFSYTWTIWGKEKQVPGKTQGEATRTLTLSFLNGVYIGVASIPSQIDRAFLLESLDKTLSATKVTSFTQTAGDGQYLWYALPTRMGKCKFTVGGFSGGFTLQTFNGTEYFSFTNASGGTEDYYVYRSDNPNLGETTVTVE